jgi:hypothetical protein
VVQACHQEVCQTSVELEPVVAVDQPLKRLTKVPMFLHSNTGVLDSIKLDFVKHLTLLIKECTNNKCTTADSFMLSYFHRKCFSLSMIYIHTQSAYVNTCRSQFESILATNVLFNR